MKPFVKPGERLGFATELADRDLWPPRLHDLKNGRPDGPVATPYLFIPASAADTGLRPISGSQAFHSQGIWIEDGAGVVVAVPVIGGAYVIKARVRNVGAFASYGGMTEFFVSSPAACAAAAGTLTPLPAIGRGGFSLLPGGTAVVACPNLWHPTVPDDLVSTIVVQAFDPFADNLTSRYDAATDRHVGRHDFTSDFFVRDWTDSATVHDNGAEPSSRAAFYVTSDVWNRRSNAPGAFVADQPANETPQAGAGSSGANFVFARISRSSATTEETVQAHFLCSPFGTGSPFQNCSAAADPSVTFHVGETSQIVSLPWQLAPTSSNHLCLAVQIYSAADRYLAPGLLGNTPGWPTTDTMVIVDNNKAQRNMTVWDAAAGTEGLYYGILFNAATFVRDVEVRVDVASTSLKLFTNPRISIAGAGAPIDFKPGSSFTVPGMLPGERRWIAFGYDSFLGKTAQVASVLFSEIVDKKVVNGFAVSMRGATEATLLAGVLSAQSQTFYRFAAGMGSSTAGKGLELTARLQRTPTDRNAYLAALPELTTLLAASMDEAAASYPGMKDAFGVGESLGRLRAVSRDQKPVTTFAIHAKLLNQLDAWQTSALVSQGDEAVIPFTARLQNSVLRSDGLRDLRGREETLALTQRFIQASMSSKERPQDYAVMIKQSLPALRSVVELLGGRESLANAYGALEKSVSGTPAGIQLAHQSFLNAVLLSPKG